MLRTLSEGAGRRVVVLCLISLLVGAWLSIKIRHHRLADHRVAPSSASLHMSYTDLIDSFHSDEAEAQKMLSGKTLKMPAHLIAIMPASAEVDFGGRLEVIDVREDARSMLSSLREGQLVTVSCKSASYKFLYLQLGDCLLQGDSLNDE